MSDLGGIYQGTVVNNVDPEARGRLLLQVPAVTGYSQTTWAVPSSPSGIPAVPATGSAVWVQFVSGDLNRPVWVGIPTQVGVDPSGTRETFNWLHVGPDEAPAAPATSGQLTVGSRTQFFSAGDYGSWWSDNVQLNTASTAFIAASDANGVSGILALQQGGLHYFPTPPLTPPLKTGATVDKDYNPHVKKGDTLSLSAIAFALGGTNNTVPTMSVQAAVPWPTEGTPNNRLTEWKDVDGTVRTTLYADGRLDNSNNITIPANTYFLAGTNGNPPSILLKYSTALDSGVIDTWGNAKPIRIGGSSVTFKAESNANVDINVTGTTYTARQRVGLGLSSAQYVTPASSSAAEYELSFQSLITIGESTSGNANPAITMYRTFAGYRQGRGYRIHLPSSNGPLTWSTGATVSNGSSSPSYGSETYTDLMTLSTSGTLTVGSLAASSTSTFASDITLTQATRPTIYTTTANVGLQVRSNGTGLLQLNQDNSGGVSIAGGGGDTNIYGRLFVNSNNIQITRTNGSLLVSDSTYVVYHGVASGAGSFHPSAVAGDAVVAGNTNTQGVILAPGPTTTGYLRVGSSGVTAGGEARFSNGTYVDPDSGVARSVKISTLGLAVSGGIKTDSLTATGNLVTSGSVQSTANTVIAGVSGTAGWVQLNPGTTGNAGYVAFYQPNQTRAGYIGWGNDAVSVADTGRITYNAGAHYFAGNVSIPVGNNVTWGQVTDNFSLHGATVTHYGLSAYNYNDGTSIGGNNVSLSGYFGLSLVTAGTERLRINATGGAAFSNTLTVPGLVVNGGVTVNGTIYGQNAAGSGPVLNVGNDSTIVDINVANTFGVQGQQSTAVGAIAFGSAGTATVGNTGGSADTLSLSPGSGPAGWTSLNIRTTSLWGDGVSGSPNETSGTRYLTIGATAGSSGVMFSRPHVVWNSGDNVAAIRYGRAGGVSTGEWWQTGVASSGNFIIGKSSYTNLVTIDTGGTVQPIGYTYGHYGTSANQIRIGEIVGLAGVYASGNTMCFYTEGSYGWTWRVSNNTKMTLDASGNLAAQGALTLQAGITVGGGATGYHGSSDWFNQSNQSAAPPTSFNTLENRISGFYCGASMTDTPDGISDSNWWNILQLRHQNVSNNYGFQLASKMTGFTLGKNLYFRPFAGGNGTDAGVPGGSWVRILTTADSDDTAILGMMGAF